MSAKYSSVLSIGEALQPDNDDNVIETASVSRRSRKAEVKRKANPQLLHQPISALPSLESRCHLPTSALAS